MKIFFVTRPHKQPTNFNVIADTKDEALTLCKISYGDCPNAFASNVKIKKGILISNNTY